jgi:hypothetical protein
MQEVLPDRPKMAEVLAGGGISSPETISVYNSIDDVPGRASLDLATLGSKGRSWISLSLRSSDMVRAKRPETRSSAPRRRWTELLGQLLGRNCSTNPPYPNNSIWKGKSVPQARWGVRPAAWTP